MLGCLWTVSLTVKQGQTTIYCQRVINYKKEINVMNELCGGATFSTKMNILNEGDVDYFSEICI